MFLILDKDESPIYLCVTMTELQPFFKKKGCKKLFAQFIFFLLQRFPQIT